MEDVLIGDSSSSQTTKTVTKDDSEDQGWLEEILKMKFTSEKHLSDVLSDSDGIDVDIRYIFDALKTIRHIGFGCSFFDTEIISEKVEGLESILTLKCLVRNKIDTVTTSHTESSFGSTNRAAVIGIGCIQFTDIPAAIP
ncbi:hypothetical protein FQA39_LY05890 [Lamprigera yunnana]|nr:hypothetical protein FQA39_LY05890 [Lamprigera yunnana]